MIGSAVLGVIGSFMPWVSVLGGGYAGISNWAGWITVLLSLVLGLLGLLSLIPGDSRTMVFAFGLVIGLAIASFVSLILILYAGTVDGVFTSIGAGVFVVAIAGVVGIVGATIGLVMGDKPRTPRPPPYPYPNYQPQQTN